MKNLFDIILIIFIFITITLYSFLINLSIKSHREHDNSLISDFIHDALNFNEELEKYLEKNKLVLKNNNDLKRLIKSDNNLKYTFSQKLNRRNFLRAYRGQININFLTKIPSFKKSTVINEYYKSSSLNIYFFVEPRTKKLYFFIQDSLGRTYGGSEENGKNKFIFIYNYSSRGEELLI
jgi:hypothetical protein